jgi:hypothetical protein
LPIFSVFTWGDYLFSTHYLEQYGGEQNVINATFAAQALGLTMVIGIVSQVGGKIDGKYLRDIFHCAGIDVEKVRFIESPVMPFGRACEMVSSMNFVSISENERLPCNDSGRSLVVLPDGKVSFCCGHAIFTKGQDFFIIDDLALGVSLIEINKRMQKNALVWMMNLEGPHWVLKELNINKEVCSKCEACLLLATVYKEKMRLLAAKKEEIFKRIIDFKNKKQIVG